MQYRFIHIAVPLAVVLITLPLLAFPQEPPPPDKQPPQDQSPTPRLDLYGDPLPEGATMRRGSLKFRHLGLINCVAYSPDGKILATGGDDRCIRLWDVDTSKQIHELPTQGRVTSLAFSPDGKTVAAGDGSDFLQREENGIHIWKVSTGEEIDLLRGPGDDIRSIAFSPDGTRLVAGAGRLIESSSIRCWDLSGPEKLFSRDNEPGAILTASFTPDGKSVVIGAAYESRRRLHRPPAEGQAETPFLRLLAGDTGKAREGATVPSTESSIYSLAFSPDGKLLATGHRDGLVRLWDFQSGRLVRKLAGHATRVWSLAFTPDGWMIAAGGDDSTVRIWGVRSGVEVKQVKLPRWFGSNREKIRCLAFSPDGKRLAVAGGSTALRILDPSSGKLLSETPGHQDFVTHAAFSPDGLLLATASGDSTARLWDLGTGEEVAISRGHELSVISVSFAPDGKSFITGSMDERVRQWEVPSGRELMLWDTKSSRGGGSGNDDGDFDPNADRAILALGFSADGEGIVTSAGDDSVFFLDRKTPTYQVLIAPDGFSYSAGIRFSHRGSAFRPDFNIGDLEHTASVSGDGRRIAYVRHGTAIRLLDLTLQERWKDAKLGAESEFPYGEDGIHSLALDGSGSWLALVRRTGTLEIREMLTGKEVRQWPVYELKENGWEYPADFVLSLAWAPDGRTISTSDAGGGIRLWDVARGKLMASLPGHVEGTLTTAFSPDGEKLASCGFDSTALVWDIREALSGRRSWKRKVGSEKLGALWEDLGGGDASRAFDAIWTLGENPEAALPFLTKFIRLLPEVSSEEIRELAKKLDDEDFSEREKAEGKLREFGSEAERTIREAIDDGVSPEAKLRLQTVLDALALPREDRPTEILRTARACLVLERIGTEEARRILERIRMESRSSLEQSEAQAAHRRLASRAPMKRFRDF